MGILDKIKNVFSKTPNKDTKTPIQTSNKKEQPKQEQKEQREQEQKEQPKQREQEQKEQPKQREQEQREQEQREQEQREQLKQREQEQREQEQREQEQREQLKQREQEQKLKSTIKTYLNNIIKNYKLFSGDCKDPKCILSLVERYKDEFEVFNAYLTNIYRKNIYDDKNTIGTIRNLLTYNIKSIDDKDSDIINFFTNNSINENKFQGLDIDTMERITHVLYGWEQETILILKKIKEAKEMKLKQEKDNEKERKRQEEAERERKIIEQRERENRDQREKEKRIEQERAKQREHEKYLESLKKNSSSSSSSNVLNQNSSKSDTVGILVFTTSAILLGGIGVAFASK
jgi:hypothetical protein